jgi:pyruvate dehydrogenase E2 component (dihydrolipoamide acetyltransferase)
MRTPLTRIQKLIGQRMLTSKLTKPCFYIESRANVTELMALRPKLSKSLGAKITSNAFLIRVLALAARQYPLMLGLRDNAATSVTIAEAINVGFPVHAPQGLMVPVIKNADKKALAEIARLEKLLMDKARSNKLTLEEMQGQTIGLSNLGVYGIDSFLAIPALVASAILAVGNVIRTVVPGPRLRGDKLAPAEAGVRKMMSLSLAVDRIIADEVYAAQFLCFIVEQLQNPQRLI